jgi:hypothetical protein
MKTLFRIVVCIAFATLAMRATAAPEPALAVQIDGVDGPEARAALRVAIERELGRPIEIVDHAPDDAPALRVAIDAEHATLVYSRPDAPALDRAVDLPHDEARRIEIIALLSGNLLRNEADELVEALRRKAEERDKAATPTTAAEPEPKPSPNEPKPAKPAPPRAQRSPKAKKPPPAATEAPPDDLITTREFNLTLVHPVALLRDSDRRLLHLELGLLFSRVGAIRGIGANMFLLHVKRDVRGVTLASIYNRVDGNTVGAQLSGVVNVSGGDVRGASVAGVANLRGGNVEGVQTAGVLNRARDVTGAQVGAVNLARNVDGAQLGAVNIGGKVKGAQVGLINISDEMRGVPIGPVNIAKSGHVRGVAWADPRFPVSAGVRFEPNALVTTFAAGFNPKSRATAAEAGIGARLTLGPIFGDVDALYAFEHAATGAQRHGVRPGASVGVRLYPYLGIFAGGGVWLTLDATTGIADTAPDVHAGVELF